MSVGDGMAKVVRAACCHPWKVVSAVILLVIVACWFTATHFQMTSDTTALISRKEPWRQAEIRMDKAFPGNGDVILVVVDGKTPELAESSAAALADRLSHDKAHFRSVERPDGGPFFGREGLLFGSVDDVRNATRTMIQTQPFLGPLAADPSLRGIVGALSTMLQGVSAGQASLGEIDPAMARLADALAREGKGEHVYFSWQALLGARKGGIAAPTRRLILLHPILDYNSLMPGEAAADAVRAAAAGLGLDAAHGVTVRLTGSVPLSDQEFASLADQWWLVFGVMLAAMLLTLGLGTRSLRVMLAIFLTTLAGLVVTAACGLLAVGRFNIISVAFIPLFVGLGVDFGIQLGVRIQAERHAGYDRADAMCVAASRLGPSLLLAACAVCFGFLAFIPTAYIGITELGMIAAIGMAIALLASLTLLPALLMLFRPSLPKEELGTPEMARADAFLLRHRRLVLGAFVVALGLSVAALPFVHFDFNPLHLRNTHGEAMATLTDLMNDPDRNPNTIDILAPDLPAAEKLADRIGKLPEVGHVVTAQSYVPEDQAPKLAMIQNARAILDLTLDPILPMPPPSDAENVAALRSGADQLRSAATGASGQPAADARRLAAQFDRLAAASPAERARVQDMLVQPLKQMLSQFREALQAEPVSLATLPQRVKGDWIAPDGRARVQVFPRPGTTSNAALTGFARAVLKVAPEATGVAVSTQGAARTIGHAFIQAGLLALIVISLLLILVLRDVKEVLFTLAPVVLSGFLTLGTCVVIGQPINFANIIAFPLLLGVGVAFHIYFVMAWRGGATNLLQSPLARAIFFSALATGTAFGSLWLSHHPGTASMGKILMLSLAWTLVCALIFEPALLGPPENEPKPGSSPLPVETT